MGTNRLVCAMGELRTNLPWRVAWSLLLVTLVACGCAEGTAEPSQQAQGAQSEQAVVALQDGARIYADRCSACHREDGRGVAGDVPPLAGSDWVVGRRDQLLRIVLGGLEGDVVVQGETYSGTMPRLWGASDAAVAAVVTYVRTSWGNDASPVSEQDVVAVRQFVDQRTAPWTVEELEQATLLLED